jgi:MFS transporter, SP family, galactose:H+ symporter
VEGTGETPTGESATGNLSGGVDEKTARRNVGIVAAIAGLAGLLFGYDTGIIASALLQIEPDFGISGFTAGAVVGAVPLGAVAGAAFSSKRGDHYGRKRLIIASAVIFIIGAITSGIAPEEYTLFLSRLVIGIAIGVASAVAPVYISEVAPPERRGSLVTFFQLAVTIGILVAYLVGLAFADVTDGWRWMLALGAVPAMALAAGVSYLPQSPRWLVMQGRHDDAMKALSRVRFGGDDTIKDEVAEIEMSMNQEKGSWRDLFAPAIKAALVVGVGLAILQQITGINTVIYYAPTILQQAGFESNSAAILASLSVGIVNVLMTIVALRLLDKAGRRELLFIGVTGMSISLFILGCVFLATTISTAGSIVAILALMTFVSSFAISLGPIFWLINAEIYPLSVRSEAASIGTMANWLFNFIVSLTFLPLIAAFGHVFTNGQVGAFWFYSVIGLVTLWFCWKFVPETKGKTLEQIEMIFKRRVGEK